MNKIAIIDIETTGFLNAGGHIVEVGIVELDLTNGNKTVLMDYVVHENGISADEIQNSWIIKNSNLTVNQIKYSINLKTILSKIQSIVNHYTATAYNRKFDINFLQSRGIKFNNLAPCPMLLSTDVVKLPPVGNRKSGYKWPSVEEAWHFFFPDEPYVEAHRAADDAIHEASIVYELYKLGKY